MDTGRRRRRLAALLVATAVASGPAARALAAEVPLTVMLAPSAVGIRAVDASVRPVGNGDGVELRAAVTEVTRAGTADLWLVLSGAEVGDRTVERSGSAGVMAPPGAAGSPTLLRVRGQEVDRLYTGTASVRARLEWPSAAPAAEQTVVVTLVQ